MLKSRLFFLIITCVFIFNGGNSLFAFGSKEKNSEISNPFIWSDYPDPDIIRVGDYYYLVTTTMHLFPGGPVMRSKDLKNWQTVSYLFDEITDTPRYNLNDGTVYGRGQWATSLRYHKGTFWALFVANDDPHKSMVFKTTDPAKGWTLHSRLPAYHDSSLFFDDDDRVYVFSGSGNIRLVELTSDLKAEKVGGVNKVLQLKGKPDGLHEGSRVIKHDGMYYLLCISWPSTGRQEICYRSRNIEGPYDSKVILKSDFGGFPLAGQGTIVDGKHGEWYGVIFQDRGGVGRVLTLEPCNWIDGWPMLGNLADGKIPQTMTVETFGDDPLGDDCMLLPTGVSLTKDYQWNHNLVADAVSVVDKDGNSISPLRVTPGSTLTLRAVAAGDAGSPDGVGASVFSARNTLTWRTWGGTCSDTIRLDVSKMKDGDHAGLSAFNGDAGCLAVVKEGKKTFLVFTEESVSLSADRKAITEVKKKETARVPLPASKLKDIRLVLTGDFYAGHGDVARFSYSLDHGNTWKAIGGHYKMVFDFMRLFMGTRYAAFYYPTKQPGGKVTLTL